VSLKTYLQEGKSQNLFTHGVYGVAFSKMGMVKSFFEGDDCFYDLASLTKPLVVGTLLMVLMEEGELHLKDEVKKFLPPLWGRYLSGITLEHLLRHEGGFPAVFPWYISFPPEEGHEEELLFSILTTPREGMPGEKTIYCDGGFLLLGWILHRVLSTTLWEGFREKILSPLQLVPFFSFYRTSPSHSAPTGYCSWRKRTLCGEVHDPHAYLMGYNSGNSGLFGKVEGVVALGVQWLLGRKEGFLGLSPDRVRKFTEIPESSHRRPLAWDRVSERDSQAGTLLSLKAFGHLGFTGTSLWIDPEKDLVVVLLTNRVLCDPSGERFRKFRPWFMDRVVSSFV